MDNDEFRNWTLAAVSLPAAIAAWGLSAPGIIGATATGLTNPVTAQRVGDFVTGFFDKGPAPQSFSGGLGAGLSQAKDWAEKKW